MVSLLLDGKLHLAPIGDNPKKILDVGTGTRRRRISQSQGFFRSDHAQGLAYGPLIWVNFEALLV